MRILALTRYGPEGASSRVRFLQYLPALADAGLTVEVRALWQPDYLAALYAGEPRSLRRTARAYGRRLLDLASVASRRFDLVWLEGEMFPYLPALGEALMNTPFVVDYDDAVFHKYDSLPGLRGKVHALMRRADTVVVANRYLAVAAEEAGARRVEQVPTVVDLDRYPALPEPATPPLRIGYICTPLTVGYLDALGPALSALARQRDVVLVVIGGHTALDGIAIEEHPWSTATEGPLLASCHIGVMPLPDRPWERGKSGYKLIQTMACGRPVVASPIGENTQIVEETVGFLAQSNDEWTRALLLLADDATLRRRLGLQARQRVAERYSLAAAAPRLVAILRAAATRQVA